MRPPRSVPPVLVLSLALAVSVVAGACSSSDPSAGGPATAAPTTRRGTTAPTVPRPATRTKAEVIAQGDAICVASHDRIAAIPEPRSAADLRPAVEQLLAERRDEIRRLDELGPPTTDAEAFADVVARFTTAADTLESKLPAIEQNPEVVTSDPAILQDNAAAAAAAAAFGFTACGTGATAADPGPAPTTAGAG